MTSPQSNTPSSAEPEVIQYGRVSPWAILALIAGVLSGAAVISPLLWLIPMAGIVFSLIALRNIKTSDGNLWGRNAAVLGLMLSLFFGAAGPAHTLSRRHWLETRAQEFAQGYLDLLVQNEPLRAHQFMRPAGLRR